MYAADTHLSKTTNLNGNGIYHDLNMLEYGIKINLTTSMLETTIYIKVQNIS